MEIHRAQDSKLARDGATKLFCLDVEFRSSEAGVQTSHSLSLAGDPNETKGDLQKRGQKAVKAIQAEGKAARSRMSAEERKAFKEEQSKNNVIMKEARTIIAKASPVAVVVVDMLRKGMDIEQRDKLAEMETAIKTVMAEASKRLVAPTAWPIGFSPEKITEDAKAFVSKQRKA